MPAVLHKEDLLKKINNSLSLLEVSTRNLTFQGLFDQHLICEDFFAGLLNTAFGWRLELLATRQAAVDLNDPSNHLFFQVTASSDRRKLQSTITKFT